jgi:hypothetical protein
MSLRVRMKKGDIEVEVSGTEKEVTSTFDRIDKLADKFLGAFSMSRATVKIGVAQRLDEDAAQLQAPTSTEIPLISNAKSASEAVLRLLSSEWGQRPRALSEVTDALHANAMPYPGTTLSGVLFNLVKNGKVRRFKTSTGYVYGPVSSPQLSDAG